jgi:PTH1 family peptidyl-tRNA hydrolase
MALFQRKPTFNESKPFYTLSLNKTVLMVGLGNIGKEFEKTRHNIGFEALDYFVDKQDEMSNWQNKGDLKCHMSTGQFGETRIIAIKPTTMMNLSGEAVRLVTDFYKIPASSVVIIHDELDIPFGQIRMRSEGSDAGHNGIKSVISTIGQKFGRVKIGIGPKTPEQIDSSDFVLGKFSKDELANMEPLNKEVSTILIEYVYGGSLNQETRSFLIK